MTSTKGPKTPDSAPFTAGFTPGEIPSQVQQFAAQWAQSVHEQIDRVAQAAEQMGTWRKEGLARAQAAADEATKLAKSSFDYGLGLAEAWQSAAFEAARKAVDMVAPRA
jgi:hypothetical protein